MAEFALAVLALLWLGYLVVERVRLERDRRAVPRRIAVTGSRGKTTVTRLLASVLREGGWSVLAKSTGSEAVYVLPNGTEEPIRRRGRPSIIEQKRLLGRAAKLGAETVVAEVMSIHPEAHRVEARGILQPELVLATNFRVDHVDAQGGSRDDVASVLALDVPGGGRALVPDAEWRAGFAALVEKGGGSVERIPSGTAASAGVTGHHAGNLDLVVAAARSLGIADEAIREGVRRARGDLGEFGIWRYPRPDGREPWLVVNAFAANDPQSTLLLHDRVMHELGPGATTCTGLLSLRADRGDRTLQWLEALEAGALDRFTRLFVSGIHARALKNRLRHTPGAKRVVVLRSRDPAGLMRRVLETGDDGPGLLFGFGNFGGIGESLVRHWREVGDSYGV